MRAHAPKYTSARAQTHPPATRQTAHPHLPPTLPLPLRTAIAERDEAGRYGVREGGREGGGREGGKEGEREGEGGGGGGFR